MQRSVSSFQITLFAGVLSTLAYLYLTLNSQHYGDASLIQMLSVCSFSFILCSIVWYHHYQQDIQISVNTLLIFAIIFRALGLFAFPVLEDDVYRYLWDGRQTIVNGSPYGIAPSNFFDDENLGARFEDILSGINYPNVATIYGPLCQWIFAISYLIAPGEIWPLQVIFCLADMAIILLLLKLAKPNSVLLYAWSPLVIKEFAYTAHPDVFGALLVVLSLLAYQRGKAIYVGILLGLAVGIKIIAVMVLPFLLGFKYRGWIAFIATVLLIALPFGIVQAWFPEGLKVMSSNWFFNAPLYTLFNATFSSDSIAIFKYFLLACLAISCGWYLLHTLWGYLNDSWPSKDIVRGDLLYGGLFLCMPALNPWYLVWMLPFAVIRPSLWAWVASSAILLSYASGINLDTNTLRAYQHPSWVLIIEFGIILAAIIAGATIFRKRQN